MNKYIDAEKLIAEIDGMLSACTKQTHTGVYNTCHRIKGIIASLQQEQPEGLHFTPLNRLIQKIPSEKWNDSTNNYAKKLRDCLIKEGYLKDANVLQGYISYMNGNNFPMATMDEKEQPDFPTTADRLVSLAECLEMDGDCLFNGYSGTECGEFLRELARKQIGCKPAEWSEEDENMIRFYEMDYNNQIGDWPAKKVVEMRLAFKDWLCVRLKYLRPQPSWKPCKDQMGTLKDTEGTHNGHDYVDLGIRNDKGERILFATCNIGASCPEEYGDYFACGETSIRKRQDTPFTLDNAPFYNNKTHKFDKYNLEDKLGTLKETDDVATVMWGKGWRMPGREEFKLLLEQTDHKWVTNYKDTGINGYLFAGKDKYSSSVLFLPAAGNCYVDSARNRAGDYGDYWSRSIYTDEPDIAYNLYFDFEDGNYCVVSLDYRYSGLSVRPVLVLPE